METPILNRGTGAGGANTNKNGKDYEQKTSNRSRLLESGFVSIRSYLEKKVDDTTSIFFFEQVALKEYMRHTFGCEVFRHPDEAYLLKRGDSYILKILEKKHQNVPGSVDTKLLAGPMFVEEYAACLDARFQIRYAFCLSPFLKKEYEAGTKKAAVLRSVLERHGVQVFFGDDEDYFTKLDAWIYAE